MKVLAHCFVLFLFFATPILRGATRTAAPPNIVFILFDDLGWRDFGCYGSTFYETPNIDRLAKEGMRFTDAYAACPVCSPTRASLMTGKYPARVGVTDFLGGGAQGKVLPAPFTKNLPLEEITLARALSEKAKYQTWHIGKWHLGPETFWPDKHGFDVNIAGCHFGTPPSYFSPYKNPTLTDGPPGEYLTDRLTDESIRLIAKRDSSRPFFLNLWHHTVHVPIQPPKNLVKKYQDKARRLGLDEKSLQRGESYPSIQKRDKHIMRRTLQSNAEYAAMVENADTNIGRLLKAIDESGLADNTIVIISSDNGGVSTSEGSPTCNSPLREGKGWLYEGGIRVPLIVRWPGKIEPGRECDVPVTSPDFYPTMLDAAGLGPMPKQHVDGVNLTQLMRGETARDAIYWHYPHYGNQGGTPGGAMRERDWKLIEFYEDNRLELFNLKDDLSETKNLASEQPDRVRRMHEKLVEWRKSVGAIMPKPNPEWK